MYQGNFYLWTSSKKKKPFGLQLGFGSYYPQDGSRILTPVDDYVEVFPSHTRIICTSKLFISYFIHRRFFAVIIVVIILVTLHFCFTCNILIGKQKS